MVIASKLFKSTTRSVCKTTGRAQHQIARQAGIHPSTLSNILNDALPIKRGDERVRRVAIVLGLNEDDAFEDREQ